MEKKHEGEQKQDDSTPLLQVINALDCVNELHILFIISVKEINNSVLFLKI